KSISNGLYKSIKRFPLTILLSVAVASMLIAISELQPINNSILSETLNRITMILALGIPLSLCIKTFWESRANKNTIALIAYYLSGVITLVLYYFFLLNKIDTVEISRYAGVSLALYLTFLFIPYLANVDRFEMYIIKIFTGLFTTIVYSVVLFAGLSAIIFALDKLLGISLSDNAYFYTWILVVCVFAPTYFLAGIPLRDDRQRESSYPKIIRVLFLYIIMPLLAAYTTILYIYFIKIVLTQEWPIGLVSHLVLWYSVIVAVVLFFITPIRDENRWARLFTAWFPRVIIPILIMMFFSMGIRVKAYGVTENRYYVILLGLWVSGVMIYYSLAKVKKNIIPFVALSIIAVVSVFGPLSSFSISKTSQNSRFQGILKRNNMIEDGQILKAPEDIAQEDKDETSRILDYFEYNHSFDDIKNLPLGFKREDMNDIFGFSYEQARYEYGGEWFSFEAGTLGGPMDISGYDYMYTTMAFGGRQDTPNSELYVKFDRDSGKMDIIHENASIYSKDLEAIAKGIIEDHRSISSDYIIPKDGMTIIDENEQIKVKIIFIYIGGENDVSAQEMKINNIEFQLLFTLK
ncbi:MAG TPA: DUF4153 domain-containing protein, partial [Clostridia bacterium]|nr:DUF4153 domain-containing protein [Clostridia bacterium]